MLNEASQKAKGITACDVTYMWDLNYDTDEPVYETESESWTERTDGGLPRRRGGWGGLTGSLELPDANYDDYDVQSG